MSRSRRAARWLQVLATLLVACSALTPVAAQTGDPNACDESGDAPDVIVGDIDDVEYWGQVDGISAYSIGTISCNIGTCWLNWIYQTPEHPVIGQNMFRLADGRLEQLGQSWLKHGFFALSNELCDTGCLSTDGTHLGVNCSDPYWAGLNGDQSGLGPKFEVNASNGVFPFPPTDQSLTGDAIYKRIQVKNFELDPASNPGALYFVEGQYVASDDAAAKNNNNNASYREVLVSDAGGSFDVSVTGSTQRERAAIYAWEDNDPDVVSQTLDVPGDGRFIVASKATSIGHGYWHYEYAVQNLNSDRSAGSFRVPIPAGTNVIGVGFHDVAYHSGEPFDGTDWAFQVLDDGVSPAAVTWSTTDYAVDRDANALRWGTLYNFRFDADVPPDPALHDVRLGLFSPGSPAEATAAMLIPLVCDDDGSCEPGEDCNSCPGDCSGDVSPGFCGDGVCELDLGEDCVTCAADCNGLQSGTPSNRFCCGSGGGTGPIDCSDPRCTENGLQCVQTLVPCCGDGTCSSLEDPCGCPADCGPCEVACSLPEDCDDGRFCNGVEDCVGGFCAPGAEACPGDVCDEQADFCFDCFLDDHCDDHDFCTGVETCVNDVCVAGSDPCPGEQCDPAAEICAECVAAADCDDGLFCNGQETCDAHACVPGTSPCSGEDFCDEDADICIACTVPCDDGLFCNGQETCIGDTCTPAEDPCPAALCDEVGDSCVDCFDNGDCDDGVFCNGQEVCTGMICYDGVSPCYDSYCDEQADVCVPCSVSCDDGLFCNGTETCIGDTCLLGTPPCVGMPCNEEYDTCSSLALLQPAAGEPLQGLTPGELDRFSTGSAAFATPIAAGNGLGPVFNAPGCGSCHAQPLGGDGPVHDTRFGFVDPGSGAFDPLVDLGGPLLQTQSLSAECTEVVPAEANLVSERRTSTALGAGLIEAIPDADIEALADNPPPGISGRVHHVMPLESPGETRAGRFGWKAQAATLLSFAAQASVDEMGLTNRLITSEHAPNGDPGLLAQCDAVTDPEDGPDGQGLDLIDRFSDFTRFLAPPPQTPRSGMSGEGVFVTASCDDCHLPSFSTPDDPSLPAALRARTLKPYSDFLLHDMGDNGDPIEQGAALAGEVRTPPLWGLVLRSELWHDGRISGGTFADRVIAAIELHDTPGSEAQLSAQSLLGLPQVTQDHLVTFLASLGRRPFDQDSDQDVDQDDYALFLTCFNGPGGYTANDPCAISDADGDQDVDQDDYELFRYAFEGEFGGAVPDGAGVPGTPLLVDRDKGTQIRLSWDPSCVAADGDYEVYQGPLGNFGDRSPVVCSTDGQMTVAFEPAAESSYYLVVPTNGVREGSYGFDGDGNPRDPLPGSACRPQTVATCP